MNSVRLLTKLAERNPKVRQAEVITMNAGMLGSKTLDCLARGE